MSTVISAEIPDTLHDRVEEKREHDESKSAAIRRTLRDGTKADELQQENHELRKKLGKREQEVEELRDKLDEQRDALEELHKENARTIALPRRLTLVGVAWIGTLLVADGTGLIVAELEVGTTAIGITTLVILAVYAAYSRYTEDPA